MTIKERLENLTDEQRRQLQYAFEQEMSQYVEVGENEFMGVNVGPIQHLKVVDSAGVWSYGKVKKGDR